MFTHFLVQGLQTGAADLNKDGLISLDELYDYVYDQVLSSGGKRQTPQKFAQKVEGQLVIARSPFQAPPAAVLPEALQLAIDSPFAGVREGAVTELSRLLTGVDAQMAAAARLALEKLGEDDSRRVSKAAIAALQSPAVIEDLQGAKPPDLSPKESESPPDLDIKLSFIPEHPEPIEDVRWTISIHNRGQAELVELAGAAPGRVAAPAGEPAAR